MKLVEVQSAAEMQAACTVEFPSCEVLLMAAAVADFRPAEPVADKIKKDGGPPAVVLEPTEDILRALAPQHRPGQVVVGFAAEHGEGAVDFGRQKLLEKNLDMVVVNDISRRDIGFDSEANEVVIVTADHERRVPRADKRQVAEAVLDEVARQREEAHGGTRAPAGSAARD